MSSTNETKGEDSILSTTTSKQKQRWFPLESNPTLINWYIQKLGFDTSKYEFVELFSIEDWALDMINQPAAAVMLLYPLTDKQLENTPAEESTTAPRATGTDNVWFMKQRIGNACGTIALIHALANLPPDVSTAAGLVGGSTKDGESTTASTSPSSIDDGDNRDESNNGKSKSWLQQFFHDAPCALDPIKKAERLEADTSIAQMHDTATNSVANATDRGNIDDRVVTHFVALVESDGTLYELDGRKEGPIAHGPTSSSTLLKDACTVIQKFMKRDPDDLRFTITVLAPK